MRVISGTAKGLRLATPGKAKGIRPVEDRVKESLFNILFDVENLHVLDCFAGTGAIGIEALSRGAAHATFVDNGRVALGLINENLQRAQMNDRASIIAKPYDRALQLLAKQASQFDLLFIDPPYRQDLVEPALSLIDTGALCAPNAKIIIEHDQDDSFTIPKSFTQCDQRKFGQTVLTFLATTSSEQI